MWQYGTFWIRRHHTGDQRRLSVLGGRLSVAWLSPTLQFGVGPMLLHLGASRQWAKMTMRLSGLDQTGQERVLIKFTLTW